MNYRPITDVWIMGRPKVKYYGAYPAGFLHRARALMGVGEIDPILHVCAGRIRQYPYRGLGPNDKTIDIDPATEPDYCGDVREGLPVGPWKGVMIDRPYTEADAARYALGADVLPPINQLLKNSLWLLEPGQRVGVLDYKWPNPQKEGREVAVVAVGTGRDANARWFTVWEKL